MILVDSKEEIDNTLPVRLFIKIDEDKTKIRIVNKCNMQTQVILHGKWLESVDEFTYFRSKITCDGMKRKNVVSSVNLVRIAFNKKQNFTSNNIKLELRKRLVKS